MHVRCPDCHDSIQVDDDATLSHINCSTCGEEFSLVGDETIAHQPDRKTVANFDLIDLLGTGAFGAVWKARDNELDRFVAIKLPRKGKLVGEDAERFFREARGEAQLKHPNIVPVHEVGRDGDQLFIVSALIAGATLADRLTDGPISFTDATSLCAKAARALHHAHEAGIVHRDLKPQNIMLDSDGEPHIMDFGLARRKVGEVTMTAF